MTVPSIALESAEMVATILHSVEISDLVEQLEATKWTGRPGYAIRTMMGVVLAKSVYAIPCWTRTLALIKEHAGLRMAIGCSDKEEVPSIDAVYRFTAKLLKYKDLLDQCIADVIASLQEQHPEMGKDIAIDASDMPAYARGAKTRYPGGPERKLSDPDASWGHRSAVSTRNSGSFYGYKIHVAVDTATELPLAWTVATAKDKEQLFAVDLLDETIERGFHPETLAADKGYDSVRIYDACTERGTLPIIPLKLTGSVKKGQHKPPTCEHGVWKFAGTDYKRKATKWRCPSGECKPSCVWVKADRLHPLIPRETERWHKLYCRRPAVERGFGRLKNEWGLTPLRVRSIERVRLHTDLTILTKLACALSNARVSSGDLLWRW